MRIITHAEVSSGARLVDALVEKCDSSRPEFSILQRGTVIRQPHDGRHLRIIQIDCHVFHAGKLLALAKQVYLNVVPDIEKVIASLREV